jgi:hypothetical protein
MPYDNIAPLDRVLRVVAGILLLALASDGTIGRWGYLGVLALATGVAAYCPLYELHRRRTTRK